MSRLPYNKTLLEPKRLEIPTQLANVGDLIGAFTRSQLAIVDTEEKIDCNRLREDHTKSKAQGENASYKVDQLKIWAKKYGIKTTQKKADLVRALRAKLGCS